LRKILNTTFKNIFFLFKKNIIKNILLYGGGNVAMAASSFLLIPIYIRNMPIEEYGKLTIALSIPVVLTSIMTLQLEGSVMRYYYEWKRDNIEKKAMFTIWVTMLAWSFLMAFLFLLLGNKFFKFFFHNLTFDPYFIIVIYLSLIAVSVNYVGKILRIKENAKLFVFINYFTTILKFIFIFIAVVIFKLNSIGALYAVLISDIITLIPVLYILYINFEFKFYRPAIIQAIKLELPSAPGQLLLNFTSISDRFILDKFFKGENLGIYVLATKIGSLLLILFNMIQLGLTPYYLKISSNINNSTTKINKVNKLLFYFIFISAAILILFSPEIVFLIGSKVPRDVIKFIPLIVVGYYFQTLQFSSQIEFYIQKKLIYTTYSSILMIILTFVLSYLLSPIFGLLGLSMALILTSYIILVINNYFCHKLNSSYEKPSNRNFVLLFLLGIAMFAISFNQSILILTILFLIKFIILFFLIYNFIIKIDVINFKIN